MPGNVAAATVAGIMPQTLCTAFTEIREFVELQSEYHDGTVQKSQLATASRKSFRLAKRISASDLGILKTFWDSHYASAFYFYNPAEGTPVGSNYDPAGNNTLGRYPCVFRGAWNQSTDVGRSILPGVEIVEIA